MAAKSLAKKLLIKPGYTIQIVNSPEGYMDELGELPDDVTIKKAAKKDLDLIHLFVHNSAELNRYFPKVIKSLKYDGVLWISYPKKSSKVETDLSRDEGWSIVFDSGYRFVSMVSVNDIWSACRIRLTELVKSKK